MRARIKVVARISLAAVVALLVIPRAEAATYSWTGSVSNLWSNQNNWNPVGVPAAGDTLAFPSGTSNSNNLNDLPAGTIFKQMVFNAAGYTINGNTIGLTSGISTPNFGSTLVLNAPFQLEGAQQWNLNGAYGSVLNSAIALNGYDLSVHAYGITPMNGVISGSGNLTVSNGIQLKANNTYLGTTTINSQAWIYGSQPQSNVIVNGELMGNGASVGNVTMNSYSSLFPGTSCCDVFNGVGRITTRNLTFSNNSSLRSMEISGATAGSTHDQIKTVGAVTIGSNVSLSVALGASFSPAVGQEIILIDNDGADAIVGTFAGYAQGAVVRLNSFELRVSYTGGDGNDLTFTCTSAPKTWTGAVSNLWSQGGNWIDGTAPASGAELVFPAGSPRTNTMNDLPAGTTFKSLTFYAAGYTINGNTIGLTNGISTPNFGSTIVLNAPFQLEGTQQWNLNGAYGSVLNSAIALNGYDLSVNAYGITPMNGVISGSGNLTVSNGIQLKANNTYLGTTTINSQAWIYGSQPQSNVIVNGELMGNGGSLGNVTMNSYSSLFPGTSCCDAFNGVGRITTRNLTFSNNSSLRSMEISGSNAGSTYDQIKTVGTVTIGSNVNFQVALGTAFVPSIGQKFTLIDNDGVDPVVGAFGNYAQGAVITLNGVYAFQLSYFGGDGNDVTLTSLNGKPATATTLTSSVNPASSGQAITFTATVTSSSSTPTGAVRFNDGSNVIGTATLQGGAASFTTSSLRHGVHLITAEYSGDVNVGGSTSEVLSQLVDTPPSLVVAADFTVTPGLPGSLVQLATASDVEDSAGSLVFTVAAPPGISVMNVANVNGGLRAIVAASCAAAPGANLIVITVTDSDGRSTSGSIRVAVTANAASLGSYSDLSLPSGGSATVTPSVSPSGQATLTVGASAGYTGTVSVDAVSGAVSLSNANSGTHTITVTATANCGLPAQRTFTVVVNRPPVAVAMTVSVDEDSSAAITLAANDPDADTLAYSITSVPTHGTLSGTAPNLTYIPASNYHGSDAFTFTVADPSNAQSTATVSITVRAVNDPPAVDAGTDRVVREGESLTLAGSHTDVDSSSVQYDWLFGDGSSASGNSVSHTYADDGAFTTELKVTDDGGKYGTDTAAITVLNAAPVILSLSTPSDPTAAGSPVAVNTQFTDAGVLDTHTAIVSWGDGSSSNAVVSGLAASATHAYAAAGIYAVRLTVTDDDGGSAVSNESLVVVYDSRGAFATGGGWITSRPGANSLEPSMSGKATFGFVSRYHKGAAVPTGNTEFHIGNLSFKSTSYDWLVIAGPRAQYKGLGTIGGRGDYAFILTMIDGDVRGGDGIDKFRIKIWDRRTHSVVFDNEMGSPDTDDASTVLGGGSISIHQQ